MYMYMYKERTCLFIFTCTRAGFCNRNGGNYLVSLCLLLCAALPKFTLPLYRGCADLSLLPPPERNLENPTFGSTFPPTLLCKGFV